MPNQRVYTRVVRKAGESRWVTFQHDPWCHPRAVRKAICPDGKRHTVYLGLDADTFFSWPGRVKLAGKWIKGFVMSTEDGDTAFHAIAQAS